MAKQVKFFTLENLQAYDPKIKQYIADKVNESDLKSLKTVAIDGNTLKFYRVSEPVGETAPAYTITLPETDISGLIAKIAGATAGDVVIAKADGTIEDGGVKLADLATKASVGEIPEGATATTVVGYAKEVADAAKYNDTELKEKVATVETNIGTMSNLTTTAKSDLVVAINEVAASVEAGGTGAKVTISAETTTSGMAKSYTIKQGNTTVGTIDIPKDMVVSSGTVEKDPEGQPTGTYLVLTLANATNDKIYINVGTLVDIYNAQAAATQVQLAIDSATREISATIVAGSITATELAKDAVTTVKIADGNVTKEKLATDVQTSLGKADTAVQSVASGTTNGTIAVDGTDVAVKGLGSSAYTDSSAYATADQGAKADSAVQAVTTGSTNGSVSVDGTDVAVKGLASAAYAETSAFDAAGTAETKVNALANGAVKTNTTDITTLKEKVETLEGTTYTEITTEEINALFATT